jgi:hypothetical protein
VFPQPLAAAGGPLAWAPRRPRPQALPPDRPQRAALVQGLRCGWLAALAPLAALLLPPGPVLLAALLRLAGPAPPPVQQRQAAPGQFL